MRSDFWHYFASEKKKLLQQPERKPECASPNEGEENRNRCAIETSMHSRSRYTGSERQARDDEKRDREQQLEAERSMASSARESIQETRSANRLLNRALWVTVASVLVGAGAVYVATKTYLTARQSFIVETRPWVFPNLTTEGDPILTAGFEIAVAVELRNYGRTPATRAEITLRLLQNATRFRSLSEAVNAACRAVHGDALTADADYWYVETVPDIPPGTPPVRINTVVGTSFEGEAMLSVIGCVRYESPGGQTIGTARIAYALLAAMDCENVPYRFPHEIGDLGLWRQLFHGTRGMPDNFGLDMGYKACLQPIAGIGGVE